MVIRKGRLDMQNVKMTLIDEAFCSDSSRRNETEGTCKKDMVLACEESWSVLRGCMGLEQLEKEDQWATS